MQAAAKRPLQPKTVIIQDGVVKHLVPPVRPAHLLNHNQNIAAFASAAIIPSQITVTVQPQVSARPFLELGRQNGTGNAVLIETSGGSDVIPQISIPSPAYITEDDDEPNKFGNDDNSNNKFNGNHNKFNGDANDSFSVNISSLFDENSTSDMDAHQSSRYHNLKTLFRHTVGDLNSKLLCAGCFIVTLLVRPLKSQTNWSTIQMIATIF